MNAAKELFAANGYAAVTTKEIAKKAGISEVTLYRHFESKRNLFNDTVKEHMHNYGLRAYVQEEATYDVRHDLTHIAKKLIASYKKNAALIRMVIKDQSLKSEASTHSKRVENTDFEVLCTYFKTIKEKGLIKDDAMYLMQFFLSNIHGFSMRAYILKPNSSNPKDEEYLDWLINKIIDTILM
jgi:AcrR family transcriptional regulator